MAEIAMKELCKSYDGKKQVVDHLNLTIHDNEFMVIVGPSGCGKSTTLRMIGGLENVTGGSLMFDGKEVKHLQPKDRNVAMVFQNYALYPHLDVYGNLAFGLKMQKKSKDEIDERVQKVAKILEITPYLKRKPKELSGGQRQRVAMGRAIIRDTGVLLMDEPLSNLDAQLRVQMRAEILSLHKKIKRTIVYVTHDQVEAMTMGDRVAVMRDGVLQQVGKPMEIFNNPVNLFVAGFIGTPAMNFTDCKIIKEEDHYFAVSDDFKFDITKGISTDKAEKQLNRRSVLGIRPEYMEIMQPGDLGEATMSLTIDVVENIGSYRQIRAMTTKKKFYTIKTKRETDLNHGMNLKVQFSDTKFCIFDKETEQNIMFEV